MTKKIKIEYWLYLFFMFQPLVNIYRTFFDDNLKVFGFSLFEMINIFFVIGLWLYLVFKQKNKKALYVIGYFVFLGGYCIIHYINMKQFNTEIFERSMYGLIQESYYIFRVYGIPVLLLTSLLCLKLKKEFFVRVIEDIALLVGSVIVVTNFLGVSFCTYGGEGHTYLINGSFFDWFHVTGAENMKMFTSIGWFGSGNEISGLLLMSLPVITYHFLQRGLKGAPRFIVSMLAMIMIGTKTATMGCILVFGLTGIIWLIVYATKKKFALVKKGGILFVCSVALCGFLFYYSPFLQNKYPHIKNASESTLEEIEQEQEEEEEIIEKNPIVLSAETKEDAEYAIDYIKNNYWRHYINSQFIENYPVEKDLSFWIDVANRDGGINQNYRFFKKQLMNRIVERNGRSLDRVVGVGLFEEINCEQDYIYQYFMFGIVGLMLILGVYLLLFAKNGIQFLIHIKTYWDAEFILYMCAFGIALLLPYVTGHMFGNTLVMFHLVLVAALVEHSEVKKK